MSRCTPLIDHLDQPRLFGQKVYGPQATIRESPAPLGHLIVKVARPEHGLGLVTPLVGLQSSFDSLLASSTEHILIPRNLLLSQFLINSIQYKLDTPTITVFHDETLDQQLPYTVPCPSGIRRQ